MYNRGTKPTFDLRDLIPGAEWDNDHLQAQYDTINRMVLLIGDLTFEEIFTEKWNTLVPKIIRQIPEAVTLSLLRDRPDLPRFDVLSCFDCLTQEFPDFSWQIFIAAHYRPHDPNRDQRLDRLYEVHIALWRQGIYLPFSNRSNKRQQQIIQTLLDTTETLTYGDFYRRHKNGIAWTKEAVQAVKDAMKAGLFFDLFSNDRCCNVEYGECEYPSYNQFCLDCASEDDQCIDCLEQE